MLADKHDEVSFLAGYDPGAFPPVAVTVEVVALTIRDGVLHVLLVQRDVPPFRGLWALPGGFVRAGGDRERDRGGEDLTGAARRRLAEETGQAPGHVYLEQLSAYGSPGRDPRMRVISVAYLAFAPGLPEPCPGGDAATSAWVRVAALGLAGEASGQMPEATRALAFDHARIVAEGLERARSKLEYTPLATAFAGEEFTIPQLRAVYESVWGQRLHAGNFHRKVLSVPGFVERTGRIMDAGGPRGGRRPQLYQAGAARLLHPALLRPPRKDMGAPARVRSGQQLASALAGTYTASLAAAAGGIRRPCRPSHGTAGSMADGDSNTQ